LLKDAVDVYLSLIQREMKAAMVAEQEEGRETDETEGPDNEGTALKSETASLDHEAEVAPETARPAKCHCRAGMWTEE